jgi:hypothetical protein
MVRILPHPEAGIAPHGLANVKQSKCIPSISKSSVERAVLLAYLRARPGKSIPLFRRKIKMYLDDHI